MKNRVQNTLLILLLSTFVLLAESTVNAVEVPLSANTVRTADGKFPAKYVPPLISNGSISLQIDPFGGQGNKHHAGIWKAGQRYAPPLANLIPFGWFEQKLSVNGKAVSSPLDGSQSLDPQKAVVSSLLHYPNLKQEITSFVPLDQDLLVIRHRFTSESKSALKIRQIFSWYLCAPGIKTALPDRMLGEWKKEKDRAVFDYTAYAYKIYRGKLALFADQAVQSDLRDPAADLVFECELAPGSSKEIVYYITMIDSFTDLRLAAQDLKYASRLNKQIESVLREGYDSLLNRNIKAWNDYLSESSADIPDQSIQRMYNTGQYHLRINATKWSFPVGISPRLWNARFFGWDEMFCHQGLLTCNHIAIARRCPDFRKSILNKAKFRVAHYGRDEKYGARFVWEALEDGVEGAPPGFWNDHIFDTSNIARSAWTQYLYSNDRDWLKSTGYPLILETARYFRSHWVYEDSNGEMYIGKCTDLERLGPARDRPFLTTCGAIYTLRAAAQAAKILGSDPEEAADFQKTADKLIESLPHRDGAYIGYKNCTEYTVAALAGIFPYDIFDGSNLLQKNAVYKFVREGRANGNMYPKGNSVCPWYAGKMAAALAFLDDRKEPVQLLRDAARTCGDFGELFEINEEKVSMKPWFTTASGNCVYAVNQMLIHCFENEIRLLAGSPESWKDLSFDLPAYGGIMVDLKLEKGKLTRLNLRARSDQIQSKVLVLPASVLEGVPLDPSSILKKEIKEDKVRLTFRIKKDLCLLKK